MTTSWLVTGARGLLGQDMLAELAGDPNVRVTGLSRDRLDITDPTAVRAAVACHRVVVKCAASWPPCSNSAHVTRSWTWSPTSTVSRPGPERSLTSWPPSAAPR